MTELLKQEESRDYVPLECNDPECCLCGRGNGYLILFDMDKYPVMTEALNAGYRVKMSLPKLPEQAKRLKGANP